MLLQVLEAIDVVTQVVEDARPLLLRAIELADQVHPAVFVFASVSVIDLSVNVSA